MEGMAPALIINHTDNYLKFIEHDLTEYLDEMLVIQFIISNILCKYSYTLINFFRKILPPRHKMFFAWSTPTDNPIIYWNMMENQADLRKVSVI